MMQDEPELPPPASAVHQDSWSKAELLDLITRSAGATMAVIDRNLAMIYVNDEYARWFGTVPERLIGKTLVEVYGEMDAARFMPFVERVLQGERVQYQRLLRTPYGVDEWRTICLTPWHNRQGLVDGFITTALDVHELQVTMNALRAANQRLSSHMENSPLAVLEMDHNLRLLHCSQRAVQLMGWLHVAGLEGRLLTELVGPLSQNEGLHHALQRLQSGQESQNRAETCFVRDDGSEMHCEWFNSALTDAQGQVTSIMALVQDVSAKIQIARQQHYLAHHDSLTGLLNRAAFHTRLEQALAQARGSAGSVALLFIDLDGFKGVNDAEGHRAGDEVLRVVAQRIASAVRAGDTMARLGGDEFLVMLEREVTRDVTDAIGHRIIEALHQPMAVEGRELFIGASIGVAVYPPLEGDIDTLMNRADQAMYSAKRAGKGRLHYAETASC
ncbi:diguanylate cyclase [Acidovorax sp.]|jgi:diguanylate cyclase (GGDEF)-like protein/PAS domain S-box-containing protein|uniref:diguanylate cyclase domain-containing protein n=1 Tax=Acidovorax sp. TaxID=1872122 RepID=UPI0025C47B46|nr:diguanylate cyclase [Acidovorax sp.]MCI5070196.1 diguanylate cyclase [Acidovorax sp.]